MGRSRSLQERRVLAAMLRDPSAAYYGLELARAVGLPSGTIYPMLIRLENAGWLSCKWEDLDESAAGRRRRRYYLLTAEGERQARALIQEVKTEFFPELMEQPR